METEGQEITSADVAPLPDMNAPEAPAAPEAPMEAGGVGGVDNATIETEDNVPDPGAEEAARIAAERRTAERAILEQNVVNAKAKIEKMQGHVDGAQESLANAEAELAAFDQEGA